MRMVEAIGAITLTAILRGLVRVSREAGVDAVAGVGVAVAV